jgi:hypothetical protein
MSSSQQWALYWAVVVMAGLAVLITNRRYAPRLLRICARNLFLLGVVLLSYHCVTVFLLSRPAAVVKTTVVLSVPARGDSVVGGPSLSASFVNDVLSAAGSPAVGTGQSLYDLSVQYHIDDAYALATFQHESSYGKYGAASVDHSLGNINCAGYATCDGRFRFYATWAQGYADFYRLIVQVYVAQGRTTIATIIPVYAPSNENDVEGYIASLRQTIQAFRAGHSA